MKQQNLNVGEAWPLYDTLMIGQQFGTEQNAGWYSTFLQFSQRETHSFFTLRTEGSLDLAYTNRQSSDKMDFGFEAYSMGISFFGPSSYVQGTLVGGDMTATMRFDSQVSHWWHTEFPRHCAIQLRVQQDVVAELPAMACPCGYGPVGGGASYAHDQIGYDGGEITPNPGFLPVANFSVTQGVPNLTNRWPFPKPIKIPRNATIEGILTVSLQARTVLERIGAVNNYLFNSQETATPYTMHEFYSRYGIQLSLIGKRLVQQRGQLHS